MDKKVIEQTKEINNTLNKINEILGLAIIFMSGMVLGLLCALSVKIISLL